MEGMESPLADESDVCSGPGRIARLRVALQDKFGMYSEEYENQLLTSEFGDERDRISLTPPGFIENTSLPQGSSNRALSLGTVPTTSAAAHSLDVVLHYGTAQTGGNPV